jgi:hypothetical protein
VLDLGEVQGALYLAMEYVHGKDLQEAIKPLRGRTPQYTFVSHHTASGAPDDDPASS